MQPAEWSVKPPRREADRADMGEPPVFRCNDQTEHMQTAAAILPWRILVIDIGEGRGVAETPYYVI